MWKAIFSEGETRYGPDWTWLDLSSRYALDKLASVGTYVPPDLQAKIEELQETIPVGKVAFYNRALGSFESFGFNRNGDGFKRHELVANHGTFVKNAHYFRHHQNRNPDLSRGRPVASAFNDRTEMVDLIILADMDKCAEQIHALESGKRVPTSMGAKVAFDVCSLCGHEAKRREDYCKHVHKEASAPYGMRAVLPDGRVCGVFNPNPRFFDISDVVIGAAPESETLMKVASLAGTMSGAELAELIGLAKLGGDDKHAAIVKRVPGELVGSPVYRRGMGEIGDREQPIPSAVIDRAREAGGFDGVIRGSAAMGVVLSPNEFARAAKVASFDAPSLDEVLATEPMPKRVLASALNDQVMTIMAPWFDKRSSFMPALLNRVSEDSEKMAFVHDGGDNEDGRRMYAAYRRSLIEHMPDVGGREGERWVMKCAETNERMFGRVSRGYVGAAFLSRDDDVIDKVLDRVTKIAQPSTSGSYFGTVTGTVAEQIGVETLDEIAVQSIRNKA